jgi:iron complex transport system substrate-binding protein
MTIGTAITQSPLPQRIVSLVPAVTEILVSIGAGSELVGIGSFDQIPIGPNQDSSVTRVGGLLDPNVERIFTLRPDLVILYDTQTDLRSQLEKASIPILTYTHEGLAEVSDMIRLLGIRTGHSTEAETIATELEASLVAIQRRVAGRPKPRTLLVFGREPLTLRNVYASGGIGFLQDMLEVAGGNNVFSEIDSENVSQVSSESILSAAPEIIIEIRYGENLPRNIVEDERAVWTQLSTLPAVRNNRIYFVTGNRFVVPGPRVAQATEELARMIHPDAF